MSNVTYEPVSGTSGAIPQSTVIETDIQGDGSHRQVVKVGASALPTGAATETTLADIKSNQIDGSQATKVLDSSGVEVGGSGGGLNVNVISCCPTEGLLPEGAATEEGLDDLLLELERKANLDEIQPVQVEKVIGVISTPNSTIAPLGSGGVFTGASENVANYKNIGVFIIASHASAANGLQLQYSTDNVNWDKTHTFTIPAATAKFFNLPVEAKWFRAIYTNGDVAQSYIRIQVIYHAMATKESTLRLSENIDTETAATLVRAVLTGQVNGIFQNIKLDRATGILPFITGDHNHIHDHEMFTISYVVDSGNGAVVDILIVTPNTALWAHAYIIIATESEADYKLYEGATASNNGTAITSFDKNRNTPVSATTLIFHTPTIAGGSEGTLIQSRHWGSGKGVGGEGRETEEWELKQNTKYLMRITNATAIANQISVSINWYEHADVA